MGIYVKIALGVRVRLSRRGLRRAPDRALARLHFRAGGRDVSAGAGPFTWYRPLRRRRQ